MKKMVQKQNLHVNSLKNRIRQNSRMWIAPLLGYLGTFACAESAKLGRPLELTNSYLSVLLFAGFTMMAAKALEVKASKADWICGGIGALFVSVCLGFGRRLDLYGNVDFVSMPNCARSLPPHRNSLSFGLISPRGFAVRRS